MSESLTVSCPGCQAKMRIRSTDAACRVMCPRCQTVFDPPPAVPEPVAVAPPPAAVEVLEPSAPVAPPPRPRREKAVARAAQPVEPEPEPIQYVEEDAPPPPPVRKPRTAAKARPEPEPEPEPTPEPEPEPAAEEAEQPAPAKKRRKVRDDDDDRPRMKGRKGKRDRSMGSLKWVFVGAGAAMLAIVVGLVLVVAKASKGGGITITTEMTSFDRNEVPFRFDYPVGWKADDGGVKDHYWFNARSGGAQIKIDQGIAGSLVRDIAGAIGGDRQDPEEPLRRAHAHQVQWIVDEFKNYEETQPEMVQTGFGRMPRSTFTGGAGFFGKKVRGYRMTVILHQSQLDVVCWCPEDQWEQVRPMYDKMLASFAHGKSG